MRDVSPAVVRVIDVPATSTLPELHELFQAALGWTDSHLHQFIVGDRTIGVPDPDWDDELHENEAGVPLSEVPTRFVYLYDFGDHWEHDVEILGQGGELPGCVEGEGSCPPEDCGGTSGYEELLAALADPDHEDHVAMREWAGELRPFDREATDLLLRRTIGEVPASVRLLLDVCAGGVKLTPGGRLPRVVVRRVQQERPQWHPLGRPASIEEDLIPLAALHDILRGVGLLRLAHGVLTPTRAAGDPLEVVRRLRTWFARDEFTDILAGDTVAVVVAQGPIKTAQLADQVHQMLGHYWTVNGRPMTGADVAEALNRLRAQLEALDLVDSDWPVWSAGPSALTLLPRATALAGLLARYPTG